jgi:P27 family predicted phage terminase small subunit
MTGNRGPKSLPANVHTLRGNPSHKPLAQLLDDVVRPEVAVPRAPRHFTAGALAEWRRITPHLEKLGLISHIDRAALVVYCDAWSEYVWACERIESYNAEEPEDSRTGDRGRIWNTPSGYKQISVALQIKNRAAEVMVKSLAEFGMSPAARSRVTPSDPQLVLPGVGDKPTEGGWGAFQNKV